MKWPIFPSNRREKLALLESLKIKQYIGRSYLHYPMQEQSLAWIMIFPASFNQTILTNFDRNHHLSANIRTFSLQFFTCSKWIFKASEVPMFWTWNLSKIGIYRRSTWNGYEWNNSVCVINDMMSIEANLPSIKQYCWTFCEEKNFLPALAIEKSYYLYTFHKPHVWAHVDQKAELFCESVFTQ